MYKKNTNLKNKLNVLYPIYRWSFLLPFIAVSTAYSSASMTIISMLGKPEAASRIFGPFWGRAICHLTPVSVEISGTENLGTNKSYVIAANHQSQYDIFILYGWLNTDFKWVAKQELRKLPLMGFAMDKMGHIFIDRSNRQAAIHSLEAARNKIGNGISVLFFPEGTRTKTGELGAFKKGAFKMALYLELPVLPISIIGTRDIMPTKSFNIHPGEVKMIIHPAIEIEPYKNSVNGFTKLMTETRAVIANSIKNEG